MAMLKAMNTKRYVDSLRCTLGRLERNGDFSSSWLIEYKNSLASRIAELEESLKDPLVGNDLNA